MFDDRTMLDPGAQPAVDPNQTQVAVPGMDYGATAPAGYAVDATQQAISIACAVCQTPNPPGERWCRDCGFLLGSTPAEIGDVPDPSVQPRLVAAANGGREFPLQPGVNTVGRENADVLLHDPQVSRRHAKLTLSEQGLTLEDLGSTNGSRVAGQKLAAGETAPVYDGDEVRFGSIVFKAVIPGGSARPASAAAPTVAAAAPPVDRGHSVGALVREDGQEVPLYAGPNTIGRRAENDVHVTGDPFVSGRHAELRWDGTEFRLVDLGSTNGTFLDGDRLIQGDERPVADDVTFLVGKTKLTLRAAATDAQASEPSEPSDLAPTPPEEAAAEPEPPPPPAVGDFAIPEPEEGAGP